MFAGALRRTHDQRHNGMYILLTRLLDRCFKALCCKATFLAHILPHSPSLLNSAFSHSLQRQLSQRLEE